MRPAVWRELVLVMMGGAIGAASRFTVGGLLLRQLGVRFPWGTFAVNLFGSFAAGFLLVWLDARAPSTAYWRAFLMVGIIGGLTTFSALMVECLIYARAGRNDLMLGYLAASLFAGLAFVWLGSRAAATLRTLF